VRDRGLGEVEQRHELAHADLAGVLAEHVDELQADRVTEGPWRSSPCEPRGPFDVGGTRPVRSTAGRRAAWFGWRSSIPSSSLSFAPSAMGPSIRCGWPQPPTRRCGGGALLVTNGWPPSPRRAGARPARCAHELGVPAARSPAMRHPELLAEVPPTGNAGLDPGRWQLPSHGCCAAKTGTNGRPSSPVAPAGAAARRATRSDAARDRKAWPQRAMGLRRAAGNRRPPARVGTTRHSPQSREAPGISSGTRHS
jgi:hypothetical protein